MLSVEAAAGLDARPAQQAQRVLRRLEDSTHSAFEGRGGFALIYCAIRSPLGNYLFAMDDVCPHVDPI